MNSDEFSQAVRQARRLIPRALRTDRMVARRKLDQIIGDGRRSPQDKAGRQLAGLIDRLEKSINLKSTRFQKFPQVSVNPVLPIAARQADIIEALRSNPVIIVSGATGSGKTTQIPKMCVAAGLGRDGRIGCTQPRRIAAMTIARRISAELQCAAGKAVGYKIRFSDRTADDTLVKIMTDGILLAEAQQDPLLNEYDVLVIDEAHERSLNIDFILGLLKTLLEKRGDLKVVITSATIDTEKFSAAFSSAPVIEVSGTLYPVAVEYRPPEEKRPSSGADNTVETYVDRAVAAADRILTASADGDVLMFLPTARDIHDVCRMLQGRKYQTVTVLPLYAQLPAARQEKVFKPCRGRKVVVATNIAETSLTVPKIKYVVDTGLARIPYYNPRTRVTSLAVRRISQSSALQRQGRCGRVSDGVCVRLYSEADFSKRHVYTPPEILRSNLAEVILRMMSLRLGDVRQFPFIDPPMEKSIVDGFDVLYELGAIFQPSGGRSAIGNRFRLTGTGKTMARIPADPRLSRILIEAGRSGCLEAALIIAAALSIPDPRQIPPEREKEARTALVDFIHPASDFMTLINIWEAVDGLEGGDLRAFCRDRFLSAARIREWRDIHAQLKDIVAGHRLVRSGLRIDPKKDPDKFYAVFHKAILSGYLSNIAEKKEKNLYHGANGRPVSLFPGSALFDGEAAWIVSAELVETARLYARTAAKIERKWIKEVAGELCRPVYLNPRWSRKQGEVVADRQFVLFGLVVDLESDVPYGPADPAGASDLFVRHALVRGEVDRPPEFMRHNRKIIEDVIQLEDRLRRKDFLVSEEDLFLLFRKRLQASLFSLKDLKKHLKKYGDAFLRLSSAEVIRQVPDENKVARFPETITAGGLELPVAYKFDPQDAADGVTVKIPARAVPDVDPGHFDWLVPGLLPEKVTALLKNLPKEYRKKLVPLSHTVDVIIAEMPRENRSLIMVLSDFISHRFGIDIPGTAWQQQRLPDYLSMRLAIVDDGGQPLALSRDSTVLNRFRLPAGGRDNLADIRQTWEKDEVDHRSFPDLPEEIVLADGRGVVYPGLETHGPAVRLRLFSSRAAARAAHCHGVRGLLEKRLSREVNFMKQDVALSPSVARQAVYLGGAESVSAGMAEEILTECFCRNIRTRTEFEAYAARITGSLYQLAHDLKQKVEQVVTEYYMTRKSLADMNASLNPRGEVAREMALLLDELVQMVPINFVKLYDRDRLERLSRYIRALSLRARRAIDNFPAHGRKKEQIKWAVDELNRLMAGLDASASEEKRRAVESFFWMVEEYKLSVFVPEEKTAYPVSKKRLQEKGRAIERMI